MRHDDLTGGTDRLRTGAKGQLVHLSDIKGFKIPEGEPDIRGWDVKTADGRKIGDVEDLIVDTELGRLRYIEVKLDRKVADRADKEYVLVPVGAARLDDKDNDVIVNLPGQLAGVPTYDRRQLSRDYEHSLRTFYEPGIAPRATAEPRTVPQREGDFYAHPLYEERTFFGTRRRGREDRPYFIRAG